MTQPADSPATGPAQPEQPAPATSPPPPHGQPPYAGAPHGQPPYAGAPPHWAGPYPPPYPVPFNTYAILSLVLAIAVFPPLGIYFGHKAKQQIAHTGERGVELATVGIVLGWVFSAIFGLMLLIWCGMFVTMFGGMGISMVEY